MLDPQSFVRHLHTDRENQTCHWGFDAAHWRSYVHISDAYYKKSNTATSTDLSTSDSENRPMTPSSSSEEKPMVDRVQSLLDEVKKRFNHPKLSRKQVGQLFLFYYIFLAAGRKPRQLLERRGIMGHLIYFWLFL